MDAILYRNAGYDADIWEVIMGFFSQLLGGNGETGNSSFDLDKELLELAEKALNGFWSRNQIGSIYYELNKDVDAEYAQYGSLPLAELTGKANAGDPVAMYVLGDSFAEKNQMEIARSWFEKAAAGGVADAFYQLAGYEVNGWGRPRNLRKGAEYLEDAMKHGMLYEAAAQLGEVYLELADGNNLVASRSSDVFCAGKWFCVAADGARKYGRDDAYYFAGRVAETFADACSFSVMGPATEILEDHCLIALYWYREAQKNSKFARNPRIEALIYTNIGKCALKLRRSYAKAALQKGASLGSIESKNLLKQC